MFKHTLTTAPTLALLLAIAGCSQSKSETTTATADFEREVTLRSTESGLAFVRTPDSCFENLPDWPYAPKYIEIDGLRQAYIDEGPAEGPVVLLLHGQPS